MPPTGETDDLRGLICGQNGYLCRNNLETCKNSCKRTVKGGKGQLNANGIEDLPCPVETDCNKSYSIDHSNGQAAMESGDQNPMAQCSTKGLTAHCNTFNCCNLWSMAIPNIYLLVPLSIHWEVPMIHLTTAQSRWTIHQVPQSHCNQCVHHCFQSMDGTATHMSFAMDSSITR